jgi:hypothetical protein
MNSRRAISHVRSSTVSHRSRRLLTTAFVRKVKVFSLRNYEPLLTPPGRRTEGTLFINSGFCEYAKWRLSRGPVDVQAPPPPTWRKHLASFGVPLGTEEDVRRACAARGLDPEELDARVSGFSWEDGWDNFTGPEGSASHLLNSVDLRPADSPLRREGEILFEEFGGAPGNSYTWVELRDDLTASLLQARLIELNLPISVAVDMRV